MNVQNEERIVVNGIELFARYQVVYRDASMVKSGATYRVLQNDYASEAGWVAHHTFTTKEAAVSALNKLIQQRSMGARAETDCSGGMGYDLHIVDWKIRRQWKTAWEIVGEG